MGLAARPQSGRIARQALDTRSRPGRTISTVGEKNIIDSNGLKKIDAAFWTGVQG